MNYYDRRRHERLKLHSDEDVSQHHRPTEWKSIRCVDCHTFFHIRERANQGFRYHRCAECAAHILEAEIARGEALPVRVYRASSRSA